MQDEQWRMWVKLKSMRALKEYMAFHHLDTAYALAKRAGISPGVVYFLTADDPKKRRATCSLKSARAIEEALQCPPGFLFDVKMSPVADDPRERTAA